MASNVLQLLLVWCIQLHHTLSECLTSPPAITHEIQNEGDIEWNEVSTNTYSATFAFDAATKIWNPSDFSINAQITTRLFNGSLPSQTWRFKRGKQYQITIINNLGPESIYNPTEHNAPKDPNTTNIHTHGLHIGGERPGDSVFVRIEPGQQHTYYYNIPCDHVGGLHWWHPHIHGSVHLQVAGGAAGALIIEDDADMEGLPSWYVEMEELVFFITHIHLSKYTAMVNETWDYVWSYGRVRTDRSPGSIDTFFVNGQFQPSVCMEAGTWIKFRFVQVETTEKSRIFYIGDGECTQYLLARDGVMIHGMNDTDMPRKVEHGIWLAHSSRADVAISCPGDPSGTVTYDIWTNNTDSKVNTIGRQVIATIVVTGTIQAPQSTLTPFEPIRPSYLQNLLDGYYSGGLDTQTYPDPDNSGSSLNYWKNMQLTGGSVGGQQFESETSYLQYVEIDRIHTWEVTNNGGEYVGVNLHPLHVHVNHFQLLSSQLSDLNSSDFDNWVDIPYGYQEVGDWLDTVWGPAWIRFVTDIWAGTVVLHCHVLIHEDQGAMGTIKVTNGCDNQYNDYNGDNACKYIDSCQQFEADTTTTSSSPSVSPTSDSPSVIATDDSLDDDSIMMHGYPDICFLIVVIRILCQ